MQDAVPQDQVRIGARLVVELLRINAEEPVTDKIRLTPQRTRHAQAVLNDYLAKIQSSLLHTDTRSRVSDALVDQCSELQIALPIAAPDWGGILLLDALFDQLQTQRAMDAEAGAWFACLRLLTVRYALADYSFFFAPQNLLRRFLNQAYLTLLSSTAKSRTLYWDKLNQYAKRMLDGFQGNVAVVNSICIEAQAWMAGQSEKVEQIEERLRLLEVTKRKEKVAEPRVVQEFNRIAAGRHLPPEVIDFLLGEWRRSMLMMSMREGDDGPGWKRQLRTFESLVELCEGCRDDAKRDGYRGFYQVLMKNIRASLISVSSASTAMEQAMEPLELVLTALISGAVPPVAEVPAMEVPVTRVVEAELDRVSPKALEAIEQIEEEDWLRLKTSAGQYELCKVVLKASGDDPWVLVGQTGKTVAKKSARQLALALEGGVVQPVQKKLYWDLQLDTNLGNLRESWIEMREQLNRAAELEEQKAEERSSSRIEDLLQNSSLSLVEHDQAELEAPAQGPQSGADDVQNEADSQDSSSGEAFVVPHPISEEELSAALAAVDTLQVGGWIAQETSEGEQRCKLAVKIRASEKMVFVNRLGIKVLDIQRQELARLLVHGAVTILDTGAAFDSTLERVVRTIQKEKK